jgi:benzil reductase ((S)-benzoin forming)
MAGQVAAAVGARPDAPGVSVVSYEPGVVDTAMQAAVRGTARADFPALDRFLELHARGALAPPERPALEIAALLEREDATGFEELRLRG